MIGWVILSAFSPDLAGDLVIYVFALLAGAAVLKVSIDFAMHYRKKGVERDARNRVRPNETAEVYTNMEEFQRATSRLQQNNK
jgi:hypothetical protein